MTPLLRSSYLRHTVRNAVLGLIAFVIVMAPVIAWAANNSDDEVKPDGRLEGYGPPVIPDSGSALTYMFFVVLALLTAGVCFMNAKRSHLD